MTATPIQTILTFLSLAFSLGLVVVLFRRPDMAYIRWFVAMALAASLAMDFLLVLMQHSNAREQLIGPYIAAELLSVICWLAFSKRFARPRTATSDKAPGWPVVLLAAVVLSGIASSARLFVMPIASHAPDTYPLTTPGAIVQIGILALIILALLSLETTLVNSVHGQRWRIKFTILGALSILAANFFALSIGLLYHALDLTLTPARQIGCVIGAALMLYSTLFRGGEFPVTISKRLARSSVVFFVTGTYLLFLGALGFAINMVNTSGNRALFLAAGIVVGVTLLGLLLSDRIRRRLTQVAQLYFAKEKYDYRLQWLAFTKRLTQAGSREQLYSSILLGFCETFGMGGAVLYLREKERSTFIPVETWEIHAEAPRLEDPETLRLLEQGGLAPIDLRQGFESTDTIARDFFAGSRISFAVPFVKNEHLDGMILLARPIDSKENYSQEDFDLMEALASQAYSALLNFRLADLLSQARDMEVVGKVSAFIVHDLKNLVYTLSLVTENAKRYIENPAFQQDMIRSLENTVSKMHVLITQLRQLPTRDTLHQEYTDLEHLARDTVKHIPLEGIKITGTPTMVFVDRAQIQRVILNLVLNAREATQDSQPVIVEIGTDAHPYCKVIDKGCGMTDQFINESLFQAFRTTKAKGMGIGLYQCKHIVEAHGGAIEVMSQPGQGSAFTVRLPAPEADQHAEAS